MGTWNAYILLILVSFVVNLSLGIVALTVDSRSRLNWSYALLTFALSFWGLMKLGIAVTDQREWAEGLYRVSGLGWTFLPAYYMIFFVTLTRLHGTARKALAIVIVAACLALYVCLWIDGLMLDHMQWETWGFTHVPGPIFRMVFSPFLIVSFVYILTELAVWAARARTHEDRMRGVLVIVGLLFPLLGGITTNLVLPSLDVHVFELAVILTTVNAAIVGYAMWRYRLLSIRMDYVSRAIMAATTDPIVIVNTEGRIGTVNSPAFKLLGRRQDEVVGMHLSELMRGREFDEKVKAVLKSAGTYTAQVELAASDGTTIPVQITASRLESDAGKLMGYVIAARRRDAAAPPAAGS